MSISPDTIDQIRQAVDIAELVREYVPQLKKAGRNWKANCPFHHEKTPSFMVSAEKGIFHCFGCHAGGDAFKFVMLTDHLTWPEAVQKLARRAGIVVRETRDEALRRSEKQKIYDLLEQASAFYHRCLAAPEGAAARKYLKRRGVSEASIENFRLGFAPQGALIPASAKKGFSAEQLQAAGLVTRTERGTYFEYMSARLVFPIVDSQGRVVAFGGRALNDDQPKYLNTPETAVYSKSHQLYGLYQAIPALRQSKEVMVLEGYMDVVVTHQFGIGTAVATLGTALTSPQSHVLNRYAENVVLLFDSDRAGNAAARRAIESLVDMEGSLRVAFLPDGCDPDEYLLKHGAEKFGALVAGESVPAVEFLARYAVETHGTGSPEAKARAAREVLPVLDKIRNAVVRGEWAKYCAFKLQVGEEALLSELRGLRKSSASKGAHGEETARRAATPVRTAEEEILQFLVAYPQYRGAVKDGVFKNERNRRTFALLKENVLPAQVIDCLDESERGWFTELIMEEKHYALPEQTIAGLLRDVLQKDLELRRQELEKEVVRMLKGEIPRNDETIKRYQDLNRQLKGSVRP